MPKLKLRGKDLHKLGYEDNRHIALAISLAKAHCRHLSKPKVLLQLKQVLARPRDFREHAVWAPLALELLGEAEQPQSGEGMARAGQAIALQPEPRNFPVFGTDIEQGALQQMETAMQLPVTVAGALMPDAHQGYGLPIGGVLATDNAVIPFGVGVDIGCRMALSVFAIAPEALRRKQQDFKRLLIEYTRFGREEFAHPMDDEVLDRPEFGMFPFLRKLHKRAARQIGTSGSGNHFVEWGIVEIVDPHNELGLEPGTYVGLLSHSGSRHLGASIADHYTKVAMALRNLPRHARHLAWLRLDEPEGIEYWQLMNLAGDYASANHRHIHQRMARALGEQPLARVENHHNFAWKERLPDGREVVVHRKGATPAARGVLGIIPGSMADPGYIVRGKGHPASLQSAAHGAGRKMSRTQAKKAISRQELLAMLRERGVELIGGGLDEAPLAYKDIGEVMRQQSDLVDVVGIFKPVIVRMDK